MSLAQIEKYSLLRGSEDSGDGEGPDALTELSDEADCSFDRPSAARWTRIRNQCIPNVILLVSIMTNLIMGVVLALVLCRTSGLAKLMAKDTEYEQVNRSPYAKLTFETEAQFPYSMGFGPEVTNHTLADIRWESIDIDPGTVAIDNDWAAEHNLVSSQPFPWDSSKSLYYISAYHTLHCLKGIHRIVYDAHHGRPLSRDIGHAMHCIDHIRKEAMCNADDYLLPTPPVVHGVTGPHGQSRVCRNWDKLVAWANDHNACYQHITEDEEGFAVDHKEIERYANCPPDSPYRARMQEYFARHGINPDDLVVEKPVEYTGR